jgi:hypothetical protein
MERGRTEQSFRVPPDTAASDDSFSSRGFRIPEVCKMTGLGRTTIYAALRDGALVARKHGRCTIVLGEDLKDFLRNLPRAVARGKVECGGSNA